MKNQPLTSNEQAKLIFFGFLLVPSLVFLVGIFPAIFLVFGLFMLKKNQTFSSIDSAVKIFKGYCWILFAIFVGLSLYFFLSYNGSDFEDWNSVSDLISHLREDTLVSLILAVIALVYIIAVHFLFYKPLKNHSSWIEVNGIFSNKPKSTAKPNAEPKIDIIKTDKSKQYSVADELSKWVKLKEDGHISEEEFNEARSKLLKQS